MSQASHTQAPAVSPERLIQTLLDLAADAETNGMPGAAVQLRDIAERVRREQRGP